MYHFKSLGGGDAPGSSLSGGVVESGGQHNLFAEVFKLGATPMYLATFMEKEEEGESNCTWICSNKLVSALGTDDIHYSNHIILHCPFKIHYC